jgi:hypothetical protein
VLKPLFNDAWTNCSRNREQLTFNTHAFKLIFYVAGEVAEGDSEKIG